MQLFFISNLGFLLPQHSGSTATTSHLFSFSLFWSFLLGNSEVQDKLAIASAEPASLIFALPLCESISIKVVRAALIPHPGNVSALPPTPSR